MLYTPVEQIDPEVKERRKRATAVAGLAPITMDEYEEALRTFRGHYAKAARYLGVERAVLVRKVSMTPHLARIMKEIIQEKLDDTEEKLQEQIEMGNVTAITFQLRTLGKERGYSEKNTLEHDLSPRLQNAAALVRSMRDGAKMLDEAEELEEMDAIEVKDYEWVSEEDTVEN